MSTKFKLRHCIFSSLHHSCGQRVDAVEHLYRSISAALSSSILPGVKAFIFRLSYLLFRWTGRRLLWIPTGSRHFRVRTWLSRPGDTRAEPRLNQWKTIDNNS